MEKNPGPNRTVALSLACILVLLALTACATPEVAPPLEPTVATAPVIVVTPAVASAGTPVTVDGAGFLASTKVIVRMNAAGGSASLQLAEIAPNDVGVFKLIFIMPSIWADGSTINSGDMVITASSADGAASASAGISFTAGDSAAPNNPQAAAAATQPATEAPATASTSAPAPAEPTVMIEPASGGAGLEVRVRGSGFAANLPLVVKLGTPGVGAGERVYASGVTDGQGNIELTFIMPATWPDGRAITESSLIVLLASEDNTARALADFRYNAAPQPTDTPTIPTPSPAPTLIAEVGTDFGVVSTPNAVQAAIDFFYAVIRDPNGTSAAAYFSPGLQAEVRAGRSVLAILNLTSLFNRFEVSTLSAGDNNTIMQANLTYSDGSVVQRTLNFVKDGENWRIDSVQ